MLTTHILESTYFLCTGPRRHHIYITLGHKISGSRIFIRLGLESFKYWIILLTVMNPWVEQSDCCMLLPRESEHISFFRLP